MQYHWQRTTMIADARAIGILRTTSAEAAVAAGNALVDGGLPVIEVSMTTPNALDAIHRLSHVDDGRLVGAGTVLDAASARLAVDAGAQFLVSPTVSAETITCANRYGTPILAGAQSATEALHATELGAAMVKLFPAGSLGPHHLSALRSALGHIGFVPTGGVDSTNIRQWFAAGAVAVAIGGALVADNPEDVRLRARELRGLIDTITPNAT